MKLKRHLENRFRGWLPKDAFMSCSQGKAGGRGRAAYVVGYGIGIGVCEVLILSIYLLGWGIFERSFSSITGIISSTLIAFLGTAVATIIGSQLSKRLRERWRAKP
jgi:hypothetical protein